MIAHWLFLILALLNLLLFVWGLQRPGPEIPVLPPVGSAGPTIQLLAEAVLPPAPAGGGSAIAGDLVPSQLAQGNALAAGAPQSQAGPSSAQASARCIRLGPFAQENPAQELAAALARAGHRTELETETAHRQSGYWVLVGAGQGRLDRRLSELEGAGFQDLLRFSKGPLAGMVSLGLYSDRSRAEERLTELAGKGFAAEVRPRDVEELSYWVEARYGDADAVAADALERIYDQFPTLGYPPPPCLPVAAP